MCGIAGVIPADKQQTGKMLVRMLKNLEHRGPDSTGVGIYKSPFGDGLTFHILADGSHAAKALSDLLGDEPAIKNKESVALKGGVSFKFLMERGASLSDFIGKIRSEKGVEIHSMGRSLEIMKDVGPVSSLDENFNISWMEGTHGIGHVRLATESKVDRNYSHPFQSLNLPDISIVHNGQITNYHNLRRKLERKGYLFSTENDSELIAQLLAYYLQCGKDLDYGLKICLDELDGTFSFILATPDKLGVAKDRLGAKPVILGENENGIAISSEENPIVQALGEGVSLTELPPGEVRTWNVL